MLRRRRHDRAVVVVCSAVQIQETTMAMDPRRLVYDPTHTIWLPINSAHECAFVLSFFLFPFGLLCGREGGATGKKKKESAVLQDIVLAPPPSFSPFPFGQFSQMRVFSFFCLYVAAPARKTQDWRSRTVTLIRPTASFTRTGRETLGCGCCVEMQAE